MGNYVIRQPDGKFAMFSTISDGLTCVDCTEDKIRKIFINRAVEQALRDAADGIERAIRPLPRDLNFRWSWEEAVKVHNENFPKIPIVQGEEDGKFKYDDKSEVIWYP